MADYENMPPPPTPNTFGEVPPAPQPTFTEPSKDDARGLNIVAGLLAAALVLFSFLRALVTNGGVAYAIGSGIGALVLPVIIGAVVGWGNERRARVTFTVVAVLVILSTMAQAGAQLS